LTSFLPASFDLHCHSNVSDGILSPDALVARASARGITRLALTDHDDVSGLEKAGEAASAAGILFVRGVEISTGWEDHSIHVVALDIDAEHPALLSGLAAIRAGRLERAARIGRALAECGIHGALEGARAYAGNAALISRAHFARYLVEQGLFRSRQEVFAHYLAPGKPGCVPHVWADITEAIGWIRAAGGVAVLAHPGRYKLSGGEMRRLLAVFAEAGGKAIEVSSGSHTPEMARHFAFLARKFGFYASGGSDFHDPGERLELGCFPPMPEDIPPVWRLFSSADRNDTTH
jgi:predicted metal-dependent phosphoesterase TrpH